MFNEKACTAVTNAMMSRNMAKNLHFKSYAQVMRTSQLSEDIR